MENVKPLGFYSRLFLVPKPHQRWRPVIDLSRLNTFLLVEKFKMETPESIRTSLIPGEWVSSIDLSDAYLHIPIHPNSRKYLRFCYKSQVFQFTSLPFGLATAPQLFTMIVKEVKLMALSRGLGIHQYLDDWLIRSQSQEEAQVNTQPVVDLTQSLGCYGQLNSGSLHQQTRRNSLSRDVCSPVEDYDLVPSLSHNIESQAQVQPSAVHRMVYASAGVQTDLPKVVHTSCRPICHSSEPQTSTVRISCPRPKGLGHRCSEHKLDESHCLCLPSYGSPSQGDPKDQAMPLPDHRNSPRLALVLGPSAALNRDPTTTPSVNDPTQTVPQVCVPQQPTTATSTPGV